MDSLAEEMVEDQTNINSNIKTITSVNHQCHCIKTGPFPSFTSRQLACTGTDSLTEEMVEDKTNINSNINAITSVNHQCHV